MTLFYSNGTQKHLDTIHNSKFKIILQDFPDKSNFHITVPSWTSADSTALSLSLIFKIQLVSSAACRARHGRSNEETKDFFLRIW